MRYKPANMVEETDLPQIGGLSISKNELRKKQPSVGTTSKQDSISKLFNLSSNAQQGGLQSVIQQMKIWECSMKGFTERPSLILEFNSEQGVGKFKAFANREKIYYTLFQTDHKFRAVIDRKWEEKIFEFSNNNSY